MSRKTRYIIGIDEVGRGPVAGPVTVCAFLAEKNKFGEKIVRSLIDLDKKKRIKDSKRMTSVQRLEKSKAIRAVNKKEKVINFSISNVSQVIIDRKGIVYAVSLAIKRSLKKLSVSPEECEIFLDGGIKAPEIFKRQKTVIKGDQKVPVIALASIMAKVHRDKKMARLGIVFKGFYFENNAGYGTKVHMNAIKKLGLSPVHRRSFLKGWS